MSSVDNRIVNMQFNNSGFESGVKTTLNSLKTLNESLKMKNATNGLSEVDKSLKGLGGNALSGLSSGVDTITAKFSSLGVIGVTALANITNSAINAGKNLVKSLTLEPITTGFTEYETKMNAIQTILTNTAHQGTNINDVNKALNELNTYADKTIYNFAEMTKNIGTFTAAGIDLDTSVQAIKGISNLAAGSGSSPQQAATAMYQLSQALAAGKVSLMDWNSVVNAGMGGKLFQDALIDTAKGMGKVVDAGKPFRETLQDGWLTSEVLTKTLQKFADDPSLTQAATQVKTLSGLMDTMKESVQSGWSQSMEYIFGNKDQAAALFTGISEGFNKIIGPSTDARNEMLKFWNETGGRQDVLDGLGNIIGSVGKGLGAVKDAFRDVFPPMTGEKLVEISKGFKDLTEKFKMSDKTANMIKSTFKGVFSVLDFGKNAVVSVFKAFAPAGSIFATLGKGALTVTSSIGKFFSSINNAAKTSGIFDKFVNGVQKGLSNVGKFFDNAVKGVGEFFKALSELNFKPIFDFIGKIGSGLGSGISDIFGGIGKALGNINLDTVFGAITALAAGKGLGTIKSIATAIKEPFESLSDITKSAGKLGGILDSVRESLQAYQSSLQAGTLLKLAVAIGILALALGTLSSIDAKSMETALTGITILFIELIAGMAALLKIASGTKLKGLFSISTALVGLSTGILILSGAMKTLSGLKWEEVAKGLASIAGLMVILVGSSKLMAGKSKGLISTAIGMIILSGAIKILTGAVKMMGQLKPEVITQGLIGVGVMLTELSLFMKATDLNGMGIKNSVGILIMASALTILASAVDKFGSIDTKALIQGLAGVGVVLAEIGIFMTATGDAGKVISTSVGMIALAVAMNILATAVKSFGQMSWDEMAKGLLAMAGGLTVLGIAASFISGGKLISISAGIGLMSGVLMLLSSALQSMGSMSWEEIGKSLISLAGALTILAAAMALMKTGLPGAAAMVVMSAALKMFIPQLISLSQLSLPQIGVGLLALAGAFTVLGVAGLLLTPVVPVLMALGGAIALLGLGCMAAGAGITLFATGLATLATVGVAGGLALTEVFRQLINLLPELGQKLAEGFTNFVVQIGNSVPQIVTAVGEMISGFLQAFTEAIPQIADAGLQLITALCNTLGTAIPQLITVGVNLILALLRGVSGNIGAITTEAINIIVSFVNTLSANLGRIIQAGIELAVNLINGLANGIRRNSGAVTSACLNLISACIGAIGGAIGQFIGKGMEAAGKLVSGLLRGVGQCLSAGRQLVQNAINGAKGAIGGMLSVGSQMISGFINGIKGAAGRAVDAAKGVVKSAIDGAKALLGIHSPSRVFMGIGKFTVMGFAKGLKDNVNISNDSVRDMTNAAIDNMSKPLKRVADLINGDIDATPKITPVMDLDNIKKGNRILKDLIKNNEVIQLGGTTSGNLSKTIKGVQNGNDNSDVVSELKSLKKKFDNIKGNTTIVNGITYDDGSSVSNAVESLVHAAKIERRV